MSRFLFVQPSLAPPGGGNLVAAWMLEALKAQHDLTLLAWEAPDLDAVNRYCGTSLAPSDFGLVLVPGAVRAVARWTPTPMSLVKNLWLMRHARRLAREYDLLLTANNESDLGGRGVQYVHYPMLLLNRPDVDLRWYSRPAAVRDAYHRLARRLTGYSSTRMRLNRTLVNSAYIAERVRALHGFEPSVLHPPAPGTFPAVPWEARRSGFLQIGRFSPEKRIEVTMEILAGVRRVHPDVELHVVGPPDDRAYTRRVRQLVRANADWAFLHEDLTRDELLRLLASHRYGIHTMPDEHFGIAVAEMVRAGCIPFVPETGGPREIVGPEPELLFGSAEDAVGKITAVLVDPARQATLRKRLAARGDLFTAERFVALVRELVAGMLDAETAPAPRVVWATSPRSR